MSVARALRQPEIPNPAFRRATELAFFEGYNGRVSGRDGWEGNPFPLSVAPRQYKAWKQGWDKADKTGLLMKLPEQK